MPKLTTRLNAIEENFKKKITFTESCWLWTGYKTEEGYGQIKFRTKRLVAHRVSYELYVGPIPDGMCVLHECDVHACVNPDHLFLGTQVDKVYSTVAKEKHVRGEAINTSVLTEKQVLEIRALYIPYSKSRGKVALAVKYGVHPSTIKGVVCGYTWKSVG